MSYPVCIRCGIRTSESVQTDEGPVCGSHFTMSELVSAIHSRDVRLLAAEVSIRLRDRGIIPAQNASAPPATGRGRLRYWNGRCVKPNGATAYICATSKADAVWRGAEALGPSFTANELREYWSECWGYAARDVLGPQTEPGVWVEFNGRFFRFVGRRPAATDSGQ